MSCTSVAFSSIEKAFAASAEPPRNRWSVVLAGGSGTRLLDYVEKKFGEPRPKQYCAFTGSRSMLEHTVDRAASLTRVERTLTVISAEHQRWAMPQLSRRGLEPVVQPVSRDTAAGVFLPLAWVRARDPNAVVYVLPSDHFVDPVARFLEVIDAAGNAAAAEPEKIVLVGVVPDAVETEYGYIEVRSPRAGLGAAAVVSFVEKPSRDVALGAIARGALWNTMVMAGTVDAFWDAGREAVPEMMESFDRLVEAIDGPYEQAVLGQVYQRLPQANFSSDVLAHMPHRCLAVRLDGIEWSDWGRADRIERTVVRLRRARASSAERTV